MILEVNLPESWRENFPLLSAIAESTRVFRVAASKGGVVLHYFPITSALI